tara:strand:- start:541 stop:1734 length:1194 start_codon:yes stop_codon:yes gene_type:complete
MSNVPKLFIKIDNLEICLIAGYNDDQNNFELLEKLILPIDGINENKILDLDITASIIKKNVLLIEQKVNFTFKDIIIILNNFEISFLNLSAFKKLNGAQISKENITYILNSLKSCVDEFENNKKILHIFNSKYCLDKKKLDNLPIGLFGDFYSHELSFNLIHKNDYRSLENIFKQCNLRIKKLLLESFVKGSLVNDANPKIDTFFYTQIENKNSKIFYVENNAIKYEQKFNFGTEIIESDISKVTSLDDKSVKNIISDNQNIYKISDKEFLEEKYFNSQQYRKITKNFIAKIAEARIEELFEKFYLKNINLKKLLVETEVIFLEISDQQHFSCFNHAYEKSFAFRNKLKVIVIKKPEIEQMMNKADNIVQFGWKKEAIPVSKTKKSLIARVFQQIFK